MATAEVLSAVVWSLPTTPIREGIATADKIAMMIKATISSSRVKDLRVLRSGCFTMVSW
jgi:hypothetical protein